MTDYDKHLKVVPGDTIPGEITIMRNGTRAGDADRDRTVRHIQQMAEAGYISWEEASRRVDYADQAGKQSQLTAVTSDLPAPLDTRIWVQSYNWDDMRHWLPTLIAGMTLSAATAVTPTTVLTAAHLFPGTPLGVGVGVFTIVAGVIGFFACLAGIIIKSRG